MGLEMFKLDGYCSIVRRASGDRSVSRFRGLLFCHRSGIFH